MRSLLALVLALSLSGCAALPAILQGVGLGAQWLSSLVDVAETGSDVYLARHPSQDKSEKIDALVHKARLAVAALNAALKASETADDQGVVAAKADALEAYHALRALLDELGVLGAIAPPGGAETTSPPPEPFELPSDAEVQARL